MKYFMGIDGGGSTLRVVIIDESLHIRAEITGTTANPNVIGYQDAQEHIRAQIRGALLRGGLHQADITAVGVGIAGAAVSHSKSWLRNTVQPVLPTSDLALSTDLEIALIGAAGQPQGILLLAGTGSAALVRTLAGDRIRAGGWGYLLGDQGGGYWIGLQVLKRMTQTFDDGLPITGLYAAILQELQLHTPQDLIQWLYREQASPTYAVAALAPLVLQAATYGEEIALAILQDAADHLVQLVRQVQRRITLPDLPIYFAGGLLEQDNILTQLLVDSLALPMRPIAKHPPAIGAALYAQHQHHSG